jgi:hypothetical protein
MELRDILDKYILIVDTSKNIVIEKPVGYWKPSDIQRLNDDYVEKVIPLFENKKWMKLCDLRSYDVSMITEELKAYIRKVEGFGFMGGAIVVDETNKYASVIELQMRKATQDSSIVLALFTNYKDAQAWVIKEVENHL